ncbi:right-handed parallel beta-helix repeat-containing protein [Domibacillus sp. DTU_2020_1001157_1_SI_ALB_TIR_016]|uniref:right-handed parallel beta-helix repeat-containing protein n=1 Tax=Domibacillus sp. DTU_2020_1001157_1_SI_ALB_TIR_016 TaxID=3077789 RepID=UPI0028E1E1DD|nr:right-handed parallel beta-helix repeat-containing protein [Domibacillus sp. DTU_2020_1001157_1_SI_ALB_TIR_016]WNS81218.1 right-handed parallel beta-helix repeat-containing protein [Domibacillus sp. DTU_2020_1001157_1_SI_ALB_TIR_016]
MWQMSSLRYTKNGLLPLVLFFGSVTALLFFLIGVILQIEENPPDSSLPDIHVTDFGAIPDDGKDDTEAIQAAIDEAGDGKGIVRIPAGTFHINTDPETGSLVIPSGSDIRLDKRAALQSIPNSSPIYRVFTIYNQHDITIKGGTLIGDRYEHEDTEGEFGHGVFIAGSSYNVRISNVTAKDFWGDGFIIEGDASRGTYPVRITIDRVTGHNNRRQGLSITAGKDITVKNSTFSKTNGTEPAAGIDLERDPPFDLPLEDVLLTGNTLSNNDGYGLAFVYASGNRAEKNKITHNKEGGVYIGGSQDVGKAHDNEVVNNTITENKVGIFINFSTANRISGNTIQKNKTEGISLMNHVGQNELVKNVVRYNKKTGISIWGGLNDQSGITVESNKVKQNGEYGVSVADVTDASIKDNEITNNKSTGLDLKAVGSSDVSGNTVKRNGDD